MRFERVLAFRGLLGRLVSRVAVAAVVVAPLTLVVPQAGVSAPGLSITKTVKSTTVPAGQPVEYTIRWRCASITEDCVGMKLVDTLPVLPAGVSLMSKTGSGGLVTGVAVSAGTITWTLRDPMPAGSTGQVKVLLGSPCREVGQPDLVVPPNAARLESSNGSPLTATAVATPSVSIVASLPVGGCSAPPPSPQKRGPSAFARGGVVQWDFAFGGEHSTLDQIPGGVELENFAAGPGGTNGATRVSCDGGGTWSPWFHSLRWPQATAEAVATGLGLVPNTFVDGNNEYVVDAGWVDGSGGCNRQASSSTGVMVLIGSAQPRLEFRTFTNAQTGGFYGYGALTIYGRVRNDFPAGQSLTNCATIDGTQACQTGTYTAGPIPKVLKQLVGNPDFYDYAEPYLDGAQPGSGDLVFQLPFTNFQSASADLVDPVISDLLPIELDYVPPAAGGTNFWNMRWSAISAFVSDGRAYTYYDRRVGGFPGVPASEDPAEQPGCQTPSFSATPNWNSTGRTLVKWVFTDCVIPQGYLINYGDSMWGRITFSAALKPGIPVGTRIWNNAALTVDAPQPQPSVEACLGTTIAYDAFYHQTQPSDLDSSDRDGDGNIAERLCGSNGVLYVMPELVNMESSKWGNGTELR